MYSNSIFLSNRRHSELRSESERKVASLEGRLEATIRKYETQLHSLQMENERLKSEASEHRASGNDFFSNKLHYVENLCLIYEGTFCCLCRPALLALLPWEKSVEITHVLTAYPLFL